MGFFKEIWKRIKYDLPDQKFKLRIFVRYYFYNPSYRVLLNYRLGKYFYSTDFYLLRQLSAIYKMKMMTKRNCQIAYSAEIGKNIIIAHPFGIVIGDEAVIKDNVKIFQQVTLGSHGKKGMDFQYPTIEPGAVLYAGAKIIGSVTVGENAVVGANCVVNIDVPKNTVAVGIPCRIIQK